MTASHKTIPIPFSHIRGNDVVQIAPGAAPVKVESAWWVSETQAHHLRLDDGTVIKQPTQDAPDVALHERPGFGPFDEVYAVGDRVTVYFSRREDIGEVTSVHRYGDDVCYEVHTVLGGAGAAVGPDNMRREVTPEIGQQWVMPASGHTLTVAGFSNDWPGRLVVQGEQPRQRVALGGPEWALIVSGPHQSSASVRRCDVGGERLNGAWWLLRSVARGWEADHGAACATHAGQREPYPGTVIQPLPTGYGAAVEAATEKIHAGAPGPSDDARAKAEQVYWRAGAEALGYKFTPVIVENKVSVARSYYNHPLVDAAPLADPTLCVKMPPAPTAATVADFVRANDPDTNRTQRMAHYPTSQPVPYVSDWASELIPAPDLYRIAADACASLAQAPQRDT